MSLSFKALSMLAFVDALALSFAAPLGNTLLASSDLLANGQDAQGLNAQFATLSESDPCTDEGMGCVGGKFAQCVSGTWRTTDCSAGTQCFALPLVNARGTSVTCDTEADALARIQATGATGGISGSTASNSTSPASGNVPSSSATNTSVSESATSLTPASPTSTVADGVDNEPDDEDGGDETCSSEVDVSSTSPAASTAATSTNDISSASTTQASSSVPSQDSSASPTASAENVSSSTSASLLKRQDAIGNIQSTLIPAPAVGSAAPSLSVSSVSLSEQLSTGTDPLATGATTSEAPTASIGATEGQASGLAAGQTVTVTVTVTVTALGAVGSSAGLVSANSTSLVASNTVQSDPLATGTQLSSLSSEPGLVSSTAATQTDPLAVPSQQNSVVIGSTSTPALLSTTSEPVALGVPTSQAIGSLSVPNGEALPTETNPTAPVSDPLSISTGTDLSVPPVSAVGTATVSGSTSLAVNSGEVGSNVSPAAVSSPIRSELLVTPAPTAASSDISIDSADVPFLITATVSLSP